MPSRQGQQMPRTAQRKPAPRSSGWGKRIAWVLGGVVVVIGAVVALATLFLPVDLVRDQLVREVKSRTGRDLVIAGPTSLSLLPQLGVTMQNVSLSGPPGMAAAPFLRMRTLSANAALWPLLRRQLDIQSIVLTEPTFDLRVDAQGRRNWDFADALIESPQRIRLAQAGGSPSELKDFVRNASPQAARPAAGGKTAALSELSVGEVRIDNGTVRYRDERSGVGEEVRSINARLSARSLASPVEAKGNLTLRGDKLDFDARVSTPKALIDNRSARLAVTLVSQQVTGRYDGTLSLSPGPQIEGTLKLDTANLRRLATWAGAQIAPGGGLGPLAFKADVKTGPTWVAIDNADIKVDATTVSGSVNVDLAAGRPMVKANLKLGHLDLNTYIPEAAGQAGAPPAVRAPTAPAPQMRGGQGPSIEDLIRREGGSVPKAVPQVRAAEHRSGWSEAPFNVAALGLLDADAKISMSGLVYRDVKLGSTQLAIALKNRQLKTTIDEMRLYEGTGRGIISVDGAQGVPVIGANLSMDGINALPLLNDVAEFDWLEGKGRLQVALGGQGPHQRAVMESLTGKAELRLNDGAIVGFNIPQMIRGLGQGRVAGFNKVASEKTDFSEASVSFLLRGGVAETKDLNVASPLLRITGAGTVGVGQRQVDMIVKPKLVASLTGQGGASGLSGLEIPVKIKGSWEKPAITPDMDAVLKDSGKIVDAVNEAIKGVQSKGDGGQGAAGIANQILKQFMKK